MVQPVAFPLSVILAAVDKFSAPMDKALGNLEAFAAGAAQIGGQIDRYLSKPLRDFLEHAYEAGAGFERAMAKVSAATGASRHELEGVANVAHDAGQALLFGADEMAKAAEKLGRKGRGVAEIEQILPRAAELARASNVELADSIDLVSAALAAFNIPAERTAEVADKITAGTIASGKGAASMLDALRTATPIAKAAHRELGDTVAVLAAFQKGGLVGQRAGQAFTLMLSKLDAGTAPVIKGLQKLKLGKGDVFLPSGEMRTTAEILERMVKAGAGLDDFIRMFGTKAGPGIAAAVGPLRDMQATIDAIGGQTAARAAAAIEGAGFATERYGAAVHRLQEAFANSGLVDAVSAVIDKVAGLVSWLAHLDPVLIQILAVFAGVVAVAGPLILIFAQVATGLASVITIVKALTAAEAVWNIVTLANPIVLIVLAIIAAIGLVVGAIYLLWKHWDKVVEFMKAAWHAYTWPIRTFFSWLFSIFPKLEGLMPDWAKRLIGLEVGAGTAAAPPAPAIDQQRLGTAAAAGGAVVTQKAKVDVDFKNVPRGVEIEKGKGSKAPIDLSVGYALGGA